MKDCVFCWIVRGEIPAEKVVENDDFLAILGIFPKFPGMTVVLTKKHVPAYLYSSMSDEDLGKLHAFAKKVALSLDKALGSMRCFQVMEGMEIDHAHLKLFPVYVDKYYEVRLEGAEKASDEELKKIAEKIRKAASA